MPTLTITDQTTLGNATNTLTLVFSTKITTAREIIRNRVYEEVWQYNVQQGDVFHGLVQPTDTQLTLNGFQLRKPRQIDWEEQYANALKAFGTNGFILLVNNQQIDDLDTLVNVQDNTDVIFLKLIPLVGG